MCEMQSPNTSDAHIRDSNDMMMIIISSICGFQSARLCPLSLSAPPMQKISLKQDRYFLRLQSLVEMQEPQPSEPSV